jgi:transcriptional regulator with XRE-family HTH domain
VAISPLTGPLSFGGNLRDARERLNLSQEELGARAGVRGNTVYRLEAGEREPRLSTILSLARALGMTGSDLIRGL